MPLFIAFRPEPDIFDWTNVVDWVAGMTAAVKGLGYWVLIFTKLVLLLTCSSSVKFLGSPHGSLLSCLIAGSMYWIDILANFMTGFVVRHQFNLKRKLVMEPHLIALYYVRHGTFFPDLIAALPFIVEASQLASFPCLPVSFSFQAYFPR